ncbi:trifunctional histidinol dehydrogenase [Mucor velutinosus]|uniref:Trifunctional histidinol dehydrogenase n=1 Tax=Mucor velutinosus TaxID=708070 RepID=A0AAN7DE96_9FUNG|nr:trifunctional histidinol dehydrogenase [Mucor velutinosus]
MAGPSDKITRESSFASRVQQFDFCGESIDASLRKLLAKVLLPKEAQQIDRAMEDFAKRYYECNPSLVDSPDVVYAVAFSILLLHTDAHNKNVKQKMNKDTFIMRTKIIEGGEGVPHEILDVMYDNIVMSEFTYADGHKESNGRAAAATAQTAERSNSWFSKLKSGSSDTNAHTQSQALLADLGQKLEQLMPAENTFSYKRTLKPIPIMEVHFSILRAKSLCLAGVRSRYGGGGSSGSDSNTNTFTIRVTKAGILDRKYDLTQGGKKATARGWRPFGCILSGSQIIFFADISSFQNWLDHREDQEQQEETVTPRRNNSFPAFSSLAAAAAADSSCSNLSTTTSLASMCPQQASQQNIPTNAFLRPVQIVSLSYAICICDEEYTKYPHVFRLITGDGQQFLMRAEDDQDMEDWMLKINYAATLKTTGVRMRPTKKPSNSNESTQSVDTNKYNVDRLKREEKAREKVIELTQRIDEQVKLLDRELQLRRNLMALIPCQKATKDRILLFADAVGKKLKTKRIELQRLQCYRDYLECELSWCASQQQQQQQQQQRKMSLPLPSHLYTFTASHNNSASNNAVSLPVGGTGKRESIKKLSNLVFTAPPSDEPSPVTTSSSTTSSSHHMLLESSSGISDLTNSAAGSHLHSAISDCESVATCNGVLPQEHQGDDNNDNDDDDDRKSHDSTPQLPLFSFPKSFIEGVSFMDSKHVKAASDKAVEMDRIMRRRSQSNPVMPHATRSPIIDKKLLLVDAPTSKGGRQRSGSEASSVQGDDDDMSVVIVNDSEELLTDTSSWPTTTPSVT